LRISSPQLASMDEKESILIFRWLLVFILIALMAFGTKGLRFASAGYYLAIAIFLSNFGLLAIPKERFDSALVLNGIFLADTIFVTGAIYFSSGIKSDLYLMYFLVIFIAAAAGKQMWGPLLTGLVASVLYGWQVFGSSGGVALTESAFLVRIPFLFVVAGTSSVLARQASVHREERERQQRFIEDLKQQVEVATMVGEKACRDARTMGRHRESILSSLSSGVVILGSDGSVSDFNKAAQEITGLRAEGVLHKFLGEAGLPGPLADILREAYEGHRLAFGKELEFERGDGRTMQLGITTSIIRDEGESPCGVIAIFKDISGTKYLERRVREAQQLAVLGEMAACVAHEIRNPLNSINGFAQLIRDRTGEGDKVHGYAELVVREAGRINKIIEDILDLARRRVPDFKATDINRLVEDVGEAIAEKASEKGVSMEYRYDLSVPSVAADGSQLREVFLNLLHNAIDASETGGSIEVVTGTEDEWLTVNVADQGCGMNEEVQARLFEPFFTTKSVGTGLGLVITRRIIEAHGGSIETESEEERGTRFTIKLPLARGGVPVSHEALSGSAELVAICDEMRRAERREVMPFREKEKG
jgi:PAS domain S-box-containing protein